MDNHKKHKVINRLAVDTFSCRDIAFLGATCSVIDPLLQSLIPVFEINCKVMVVTGDHSVQTEKYMIRDGHCIMDMGRHAIFKNSFDRKIHAQSFDLALINGNHYQGTHQIIFLQEKKENSLKKRLDQLTNVMALVSVDMEEPFDWLHDKVQGIPVLKMDDRTSLIEVIRKVVKMDIPLVHGLVISGGKSQRMGFDKSQINYFGVPHELYVADMLRSSGIETYISKDHKFNDKISEYPVIRDELIGFGPFGALMTAFQMHRNVAWLAIGCDMPFLTRDVIHLLLKERDPRKVATSIKIKDNEFMEPLLTIYEPKACERLLQFMSLGYSCPRKMLINSDCKVIEIEDREVALNVNTPDDLKKAKTIISGRSV